MPKRRIIDLRSEVPLLDGASYGRRGAGYRVRSKAELAQISRTVRRAPLCGATHNGTCPTERSWR